MFDCQLHLFGNDHDDEWITEWAEEGIAEIESLLAKYAAWYEYERKYADD